MKLCKRILAILLFFAITITSNCSIIYAEDNTSKKSKKIEDFSQRDLTENLLKLVGNVARTNPQEVNLSIPEGVTLGTLYDDTIGHGTSTVDDMLMGGVADKVYGWFKSTRNQAINSNKTTLNIFENTKHINSNTRNKIIGDGMKNTSNLYKKSKKILKVNKAINGVQKGLGALSLYEDFVAYEEKKHKHASLDFIGRSIRGSSMIVTGITMVVKGTPLDAIAPALGLVKDAVNSDTVSKLANSYDSKFLWGLDYLTEVANSVAIDLFGGDGKVYLRKKQEELHERYVSLRGGIKTPSGVNCYKPNIYIYPTDETKIKVIFDYPGMLTKVIPDYSGKWEMNASPDGTLHDMDGNEYDYLFYESLTDKAYFQTEEGWNIEANTREEEFTDILEEYGLNEEEIDDFVEFWNEKLEKDVDYSMYPQLTQTVDDAMPISIEPLPDNIFRIWFVFEENSSKYDIVEPEIIKADRTGYYAIEWGGMIY